LIRKTVTISNSLGLHMRAANLFVDAASRFSARIRVARGDLGVTG
jgi:phosphotransferase system HPr (HPr) family protein